MRENLRNSGIDIVGDVPWGTYFCQLYQTKKDLMEILIPYFKAGLENNEFCLWIASYPLEAKEAKEALRKSIPDFDIYLQEGQIEIISRTCLNLTGNIYDSGRIINEWIEKLDHALKSGYEGLRLSGSTSLVKKKDWGYFIDYTGKMYDSLGKHRIIALGSRFIDGYGATEIIEVVSDYQFSLVKKEGKWERIDNTWWKKAEKAAFQAAKDWEDTFDAVPDLIMIIDTKCRIVRTNRAMAARLRMTPEECAGLTCYRVIHGMDEPPSFCPHKQLLKDELEHIEEVYENFLGGYFLVSASPLRDSDGKLIGIVHVARDINERKQAEDALRESEEKYRNIVETANEGIWILDAEARTTYVNEKMAEMLGYRQEEMIGRYVWEFADEEGKAIFKSNLEKRRQGINEVYEFKLICKDGSPLWTLISAKAFLNKEGKFTGSLGMFTDITKRKKEEHRIRRYNRILEGINRIFSNVVQAKTEEELGNVCLSVALEVTGSQSGFINEMDAGGLLRDIAKSEQGWEECLICDKTGHRLFPNKFVVHGLYGSVMINEKSFFTNYPQSHPDSVGVPPGHPPLRSFLGVPLAQDGKTVGLIAVANREGGYNCEQQEDLEAIAPAVMQALLRKRAEEALKKLHESLEEKVKERTAELEEAYNLLKESEKSLSEAQRIAHIGNWDWNILTDEIHCSDELYRIFGLSPREIDVNYGSFLSYHVHPDDRDYVDNAVKKALKGEPYSIDYRIITASGEERTVHAHTEIIFDEKNNPFRIRGTLQDITERKETDEKIKILANAVESSNDAIVTESLEGFIISWNKGAEEVYGYSAEEILGKNVSILEPDNIKGETNRLIEKVKQGEKIQRHETLRLRKDGTIINISVTLSPIFNTYGKFVAISGITRDITERKQAEEALRESEGRLRRFYESNMIGVFYYNLDGSIIDANDKLLEITGYTREDLQAGKVNWKKMTPPEYRLLDEYAISELESKGVNTPYEKEYIRKDGSRVPIIVGVATSDQACNEGIAFVLDITERKKVEEALANIETARKKEIHHRIKNNLQVISSLLDLQAEKFNNREYIKDSEVLEAFRESQDRVISMALIHEELHKSEGLDTLNFSSYIRELAENLFLTYRVRGTDISLKTDLEENIFLDMDTAVPLGIIINELVSNSLKHAFPGRDKGEIRIKLCREKTSECINSIEESTEKTMKEKIKNDCKNTSLILAVSDDGVGIPESLDLENPDSLGIQLVTTLIDQLSGELELKRDNGTEFIIRFTVVEKQ